MQMTCSLGKNSCLKVYGQLAYNKKICSFTHVVDIINCGNVSLHRLHNIRRAYQAVLVVILLNDGLCGGHVRGAALETKTRHFVCDEAERISKYHAMVKIISCRTSLSNASKKLSPDLPVVSHVKFRCQSISPVAIPNQCPLCGWCPSHHTCE